MINNTQKPMIATGWLRAILFLVFFVILYILVGALTSVTTSKWLGGELNSPDAGIQMKGLWDSVITSTIVSFVSVWVFRKWVDRESVFSLGFEWKDYKKDAIVGMLAAIAMLGAGTLLLVLTGHLTFSGWNMNPFFILNSIVIMVLVAIGEELVFRGYILHNLLQSMNKWLALGISAALFAAIHWGNPGVDFLAVLEIFIGGVMLGINYIFTKNLWFGIALHFAWNFFQGPILGYKVSGVALPSLMQQEVSGPVWLTGGVFGFEGSVLAMILNIAITLTLVYVYQRQEPSSDLTTRT